MIGHFTGEYQFLSNFYMTPVVYEGVRYPSAEHAYQAAKSTDPRVRHYVVLLHGPGAAKRYGDGKIRLRPGWAEMKVEVMREVLEAKFAHGTPLAERLLATGEEELVEGNHWHDTFWGRCVCPTHGGRGENMLGRLLVEVRTELRADADADESGVVHERKGDGS